MLLPQPRWKLVNLKLEDVLKKYRDLLNTCLPRSLAPNLDFYSKHVPYIYIYIYISDCQVQVL